MWKITLDEIDLCEKFTEICRKYRQYIDIDVCYGRYIVDGCSLMGVLSLIPHTVEIMTPKTDEIIATDFESEISALGAWKE